MRCLVLVALLVAFGCGEGTSSGLHGEVDLVILQTADTHSALFPFRERIGWSDATRGLGSEGEVERIGGFSRLSALVKRERSRSKRVLVLDSGDAFQGSLAFDAWSGEPELLALGALGVQAQVLGNHELDRGPENLRERYRELATFPLLAANYADYAGSGIGDLVSPFVVLEAAGFRVGVIGVGNVRSVPMLRERPNELGVLAESAAPAVQSVLDELRPLVDVVVVLTHLGLDADRALVRGTSGVDAVLGGHQHIATDEALWEADCGGSGEGTVRDAWGRSRRCASRPVPIVHSGAYGKYLGRLTLELDDDPARLGVTYDPLDAHEVRSAAFELLPVHSGLPEDPGVERLLEPYRSSTLEHLGLGDVLGFAPTSVPRVGATGGDSALGNFAASAARWAAHAELAVIGSSSIRRDVPPGPLDTEVLEQSFPFDDPVLRVRLTGRALLRAFERAATSAESRDCRSVLQVSGALVRFECPCEATPCASVFARATEICCRNDADCADVAGACGADSDGISRCFLPIIASDSYSFATTAYLADGGSGLFDPVAELDREPAAGGLREAATEALREAGPCGNAPADCASGCPAALLLRLREASSDHAAAYSGDCERIRALCRALPCLDERAGALRDGRVGIEPP